MTGKRKCETSHRKTDSFAIKMLSRGVFDKPDLSGHEEAMLEKIAFVIQANERWNSFVHSVERIEALIRGYEVDNLPKLGGPPNE